jgi:hypothetical protein
MKFKESNQDQVTTSRTLDSIEKWTSHMRGASLLLEMRNHQHLQRSEGLMLFVQLRFHIVRTRFLRESPTY